LVNTHLVNGLVNTSQKIPVLIHCLVCIVGINRIIASKHFIRAVACNLHYDRLSNAGLPHIGVEAVPKIMENKPALLEAAIGVLFWFGNIPPLISGRLPFHA
jgi:hypothetical protein